MSATFDWNFRYRPAYNVSPGFNLPVVRRDDGSDSQGAVLQCMKWGLIPGFTKKTDKPDHYRMVIHPLIIIYTSRSPFFHVIPNLVLKDSIISSCIMFYYSFNLCLFRFQFNARSESICEKASFRRLVPNNRCLVAVEGYALYNWLYTQFSVIVG